MLPLTSEAAWTRFVLRQLGSEGVIKMCVKVWTLDMFIIDKMLTCATELSEPNCFGVQRVEKPNLFGGIPRTS